MEAVLMARNVKRGFKSGGETFWALKGVDIELEKGKLTVFRGRSGSGKTTLLNLLSALDYPTEGEIYLDGKDITRLSDAQRDAIRRKQMGIIFQSVALISMMSAYENVEFGLRIADFPAKERRKRAEECLKMLGIKERSDHMPFELSGGEQQRVAIARAISHMPKIIFADEPTAELDTNTGLAVVKIFKELVEREGITVVMTTHDPGIMEVADRVYVLEDGEVVG